MTSYDSADRDTLHFYDSQAAETFRLYNGVPSPFTGRFPGVFPAGCRVLDLGCGSGRDLRALSGLGYEAWGCEASGSLIEQIRKQSPDIAGYVRQGTLPDGLPSELSEEGSWDGLFCSAVLQHISDNHLFNTAFVMHRLLRAEGRLFITVPIEYPLATKDRDAKTRLFRLRPASEYTFLYERIGFQLIEQTERPDSLSRPDIKWSELVFHKKC